LKKITGILISFLGFSQPALAQSFDLDRWDQNLIAEAQIELPYNLASVRLPERPDDLNFKIDFEKTRRNTALAEDPKIRLHIHIENLPSLKPEDVFRIHGLVPLSSQAPNLARLFEELTDITRPLILQEKLRFNIGRPDQYGDISRIIPTPPHAAYPSGHAAQSHLVAGILSALNPSCATAYKSLAEDISTRREIAGVHFSLDSAAGEYLASLILTHLRDSRDFQSDFGSHVLMAQEELLKKADISCKIRELRSGLDVNPLFYLRRSEK
jgi:hypothetical protein